MYKNTSTVFSTIITGYKLYFLVYCLSFHKSATVAIRKYSRKITLNRV